VRLSQLDAAEARWTQLETESTQEREESRKLAALFQKVATFSCYYITFLFIPLAIGQS
jgi:hypothetical protein